MEGVPYLGVFLVDYWQYLREFWRKPRKTPKGYFDKYDRELNPAPPVYQFWAENHLDTGGASENVLLHLIVNLI